MNVRIYIIAVLSVCSAARAADVEFGALPGGATSTNVVTGVRAEICRDHLFDPARVEARIPVGYRLMLASESAKEDPGVAELLKRDTRYSSYAVGSLCFMAVDSFVVDGVSVQSNGSMPMAFWWARAEGPRDPRMQGKVEWLQLASWYARSMGSHEKILATDPTAQFVDLEATETEPNVWRLRLALANEVVEADVRGSGQRTKRRSPEPGVMSVPFAGEGAGSFWVITYFGHHHQTADGNWTAKGGGVFSDALGIPEEASVFGTVFQDGWSALSGLYRP